MASALPAEVVALIFGKLKTKKDRLAFPQRLQLLALRLWRQSLDAQPSMANFIAAADLDRLQRPRPGEPAAGCGGGRPLPQQSWEPWRRGIQGSLQRARQELPRGPAAPPAQATRNSSSPVRALA